MAHLHFVNKVLYEYNRAHLCTYCLLLLCLRTAELSSCKRHIWLASLKYLPFGPLGKSLLTSVLMSDSQSVVPRF